MRSFDINEYASLKPAELRRKIRNGEIKNIPTAGMSAGYAQANLVVPPKEYAKPTLVITHSPGHMFVTDIHNDELNEYLAPQKAQR